ncbi:MAG TPA: Nif3-like dinuclear metal center hexameric protein [Fimbriimonadales bacterium]|jgi:dinuclear metal center YbgI/SA1388 family protein|nr:Nif3-like dinuclear metal center hexameric protein [Fimbriimonadales bacterium]
MPTIADLLHALEQIAPVRLAMEGDPIGLHVGRKSDSFERCLVALDSTPSAIALAVNIGANAIVSHHPAIFTPLKEISGDAVQTQIVRGAIESRIALISAHTNWDTAPGGVNDTLAEIIGLVNVRPFGGDIPAVEYKVAIFCPQDAADAIIDAASSAGAGVIGNYRRCAFYSRGTGTFEPVDEAQPTIGNVGERQTIPETRIEMRVSADKWAQVNAAVRAAHPYEEPAVDVWQSISEPFSLPRIGSLPNSMNFHEFARHVDAALGSRSRAFGMANRKISSVAVVGGSGGRYWTVARKAGADALITGEVRHHEGVEAASTGFCVLESGHYHTEMPGVRALQARLAAAIPGAEFSVFEPDAGSDGRPA